MQILRSLLWLAAVTLWAGGMFAPSVAAAHPQHMHVSHAAVSDPQAQPAAKRVKRDAAQTVQVLELTAAPETPAGAPDNGCADRGCCSAGSCTACSSAVAPVLLLTFPPSVSSALLARDGSARATLASEGPKRPPKRLA